MHAAHKTNPNYTYNDLLTFIEAYQPDLIGVVIRPEDLYGEAN